MNDEQIVALIRKHGAKTVSDAAYDWMSHRTAAIEALGVTGMSLPLAMRITELAYPMMSDEDQAADLARAAIDGAKLT